MEDNGLGASVEYGLVLNLKVNVEEDGSETGGTEV